MALPFEYSRHRPVMGVLFGKQVFGAGSIYSFADSLTRGIQAGARDRQCGLLLACGRGVSSTSGRPAWPMLGSDVDFVPVGPWNLDGLIVVHPLRNPERTRYVQELKASGFPVVFVGNAEGKPTIALDNEGGIRQALLHLASHGHRRVAFIAGFPDDDPGDSGERLRAFHAAVLECGMETDERLIAFGFHNAVGGRQAMQKILASGISFTAAVASNDSSANGAMQALTEAGLRVPEDIAVIGFDNSPDGVHDVPSLTSVHHPVFERGYQAAELLADILEGYRDNDDVMIRVPTRLVRRRSCGCALHDVQTGEYAAPPVQADNADALAIACLVTAVSQTIRAKAPYFDPTEVHALSEQLIDALVFGVRQDNATGFLRALQAVLARTEQLGHDQGVWEAALHVLEFSPALALLGADRQTPVATHALFQRARRLVVAGAEKQNWYRRNYVNEVISHIVMQLSAVEDESDVLRVLEAHAPKIGIRRVAIVVHEPEGNDPVARSVMHMSASPGRAPIHFRGREFPPPEFCTPSEAAQLALVPISTESGRSGYIVLDADNLSFCARITHAVNTALVAAKMHQQVMEIERRRHDAEEHWRAAEEANSLKSRFLSTIGHELRTPLSLILAAGEFLQKPDLNADGYARHLAHIRASIQHLDSLMRDVLDLMQDDLGQMRLAYEAVEPAEVLEPMSIVGEQLCRNKGLAWRAELAPDLPVVWADRARVRQIVLNLITNAVKFTAHGEVRLRAECDAGRLRVSVRDTGVGVPAHERERIFDEFQRSTQAGEHEGFGLGLAICRRLVDLHGGRIGVLPAEGDAPGSEFFFVLPPLNVTLAAIERTLDGVSTVYLPVECADVDAPLRAYLAQRGTRARPLRTDEPPGPEGGVLLIGTGFTSPEQAGGVSKLLKECARRDDMSVVFYSLSELPQRPVLSAHPAAQAEADSPPAAAKGAVLVVEDDHRLLDLYGELVQGSSPAHRVLKADNGSDAARLILEEQPELVLLDLLLPQTDGFEVLAAMQRDEHARDIPVVVISGQALTDEQMSKLPANVTAVMTKGIFTPEEMQRRIQRLLIDGGNLGEARRVVREAMAYIHEHYSEPLGRGEIAKHLHISNNHLTRCFRQVLGVPPMTYLTRYRMQRAKILLGSGKYTVTRVAAAVGFPNEFYFSYVFRRESGMTPSAYRKACLVSS